MPRSRGGGDGRENLAPTCRPCNMEKGDFTPEEYRAYREEAGLGWPPRSRLDLLKEMLAGLSIEEVKRLGDRLWEGLR